MGFCQPAQIVRHAQEHGVYVRRICINASRWGCTLAPVGNTGRLAVRLGLRMVRGLSEEDAARMVLARGEEAYRSIDDLWRRSGIKTGALSRLAEADAFRLSLTLQGHHAVWAITALRDEHPPLFDQPDAHALNEPAPTLKAMIEGRGPRAQRSSRIGVPTQATPMSTATSTSSTSAPRAR